jgi:hypothetical protein
MSESDDWTDVDGSAHRVAALPLDECLVVSVAGTSWGCTRRDWAHRKAAHRPVGSAERMPAIRAKYRARKGRR